MKKVLILLLILISKVTYSQEIEDIFVNQAFDKNITVKVLKQKGKIGSFPVKYESIVYFQFAKENIKYFAFPLQNTDTKSMETAEKEFRIIRECNEVLNEESNKNFKSFEYLGYYFVYEHCPCKTGIDVNCAELAEKINSWVRKMVITK